MRCSGWACLRRNPEAPRLQGAEDVLVVLKRREDRILVCGASVRIARVAPIPSTTAFSRTAGPRRHAEMVGLKFLLGTGHP
jgi:hypothetical protein